MRIYKFHYRIEKEAKLSNGLRNLDSEPAYMEICFESKKKLRNKERMEQLQKFRKELAEQLDIKVWHVTPIREEEYIKHIKE